jgi:SAM-dependent methyltransferase
MSEILEGYQIKPASRYFRWMSSVRGDQERLRTLDRALSEFYATEHGRSSYQEMLTHLGGDELREDTPDYDIAHYVLNQSAESIVEIGCGDGRLFRNIRSVGYTGEYTGVEVADYLVEKNRSSYPQAEWVRGDAYEAGISFMPDIVVSLFVLEHLVYPKRGLQNMMRLVAPGGVLLLVFPDFTRSERLASQMLGYSLGTARQKLLSGRLLDALVSLWDSRVRLPRALKRARERYGPFPVNTSPVCLSHHQYMSPDVDAVYIASRDEVSDWAKKAGYTVNFPFGTTGRYDDVAFIEIRKTA